MDMWRKSPFSRVLLFGACALLLLVGLVVLVALWGDGRDSPGASAQGHDVPFCSDTGDYTLCTDEADYAPGATVRVPSSVTMVPALPPAPATSEP